MADPSVVVYRIVQGAEATLEDFLSDEQRGKRPRDLTPEKWRRHTGRSVWLTEDNAHALAARFPQIGSYVAEVRLPPDATLEPFEKTPDHNTVYADPNALLDRVVRIVPVR